MRLISIKSVIINLLSITNLLLLSAFSGQPNKFEKNIFETGEGEVFKNGESRTSAENNAGAVPGTVNIPRGVLEFKINQKETWENTGKNLPRKDDPIFVYCSTGGRGSLSAKALMQLRYKNVQSLQGGSNTWHEAYPNIKE
jgi:rhodanese-related sulfurtransferase